MTELCDQVRSIRHTLTIYRRFQEKCTMENNPPTLRGSNRRAGQFGSLDLWKWFCSMFGSCCYPPLTPPGERPPNYYTCLSLLTPFTISYTLLLLSTPFCLRQHRPQSIYGQARSRCINVSTCRQVNVDDSASRRLKLPNHRHSAQTGGRTNVGKIIR